MHIFVSSFVFVVIFYCENNNAMQEVAKKISTHLLFAYCRVKETVGWNINHFRHRSGYF